MSKVLNPKKDHSDDVEQEETNLTPTETQQRVVSKRALNKGKKEIEKKAIALKKVAVEYVPIMSISPNGYNPNRQSEQDFELLIRSMEEDGFTTPILVNKDLKQIVDGEHRWRAAQVLGFKEIPVVYTTMTYEQARISTIRHNRARGTHDIDLEIDILQDLQKLGALDWAAESLMLDDVELNRLLTDIAAPDALLDAEFSDAWIPEKFNEEEKQLIQEGVNSVMARSHTDAAGMESATAMTQKAVELSRQREALLKEAKTVEERKIVEAQTRYYRVALMFTNDEADMVKQVLGDKPAEMLLKLCEQVIKGELSNGD
ncbi:MAG: ParB N-terminal domain-containing protein [Chloroflexi bacterium]|uniref:ParB N-terminal domain-containing protein n=1 Tax=Candidatus Chlorohelix allophototropha TaxID=3003348 RepID=A0A8T7LWV1_9CHLR|nr:ParB N-terminal domain-containing protein [Chloroflexota bacterium]WJW65812.1 ParB/RepB/Spo0J family partition protein [Chloroflexota bacterium L227-S17]